MYHHSGFPNDAFLYNKYYEARRFFFSFLDTLCSMWLLVPQPGIKTMFPAVETWSPNH